MRPLLWSLLLVICFHLPRNVGAFTSMRPTRIRMSNRTLTRMRIVTPPHETTILVAGASGYIGKYVVRECVRQGYKTVAVTRNAGFSIPGSEMIIADVGDPASLEAAIGNRKIDAVISCLASRTGTKKDAYAIDYQATSNCLHLGMEHGMTHFVLLSAFCLRKPLLQLQQAKLKFENEMVEWSQGGSKYTYASIRPTAFFKSVSTKLNCIQRGWPFLVYGDGNTCRCNPIAETDLATYLVDSLREPSRFNKIVNIGGPDKGYSMEEQGHLLAEACGTQAKILKAPAEIFDTIINFFTFWAQFFPSLEDAIETGKIVKYYALEDMLTTSEDEKYGTITLKQHYETIAKEGGDFNPYTVLIDGFAERTAKRKTTKLPIEVKTSPKRALVENNR